MSTRLAVRAMLALCALLALAVLRPALAQTDTSSPQSRQILVMIKLAPTHFRPNSNYSGSYGDSLSNAARRRIAQAIARKEGLKVIDGWPMPLLAVDCYVMQLPPGLAVDTVIARVSHDPMVAWSEPMQLYKTQGALGTEGDPLFRVEPAATAWRLADLHRVATGKGVRVAVVDSKIEVGHPDLAGQFIANQDFVAGRPSAAERHGTGIAGVIGAKEDNGIGIAGIAPGARMMALRACWQTGAGNDPTLCDSLSLARALQYAIEHGAQVINLSLSGPPDLLLQKLIVIALAHGIAVVAAFDPALPKGGFPASQPGVIAVVDESLQSVPSGLYGAPGRDVPTTQPGGKWYLVNGSSYAAAHVSGLIALVRQWRRPGSSPITIARSPHGIVDACATLLRTSTSCDCSCALALQIGPPGRR